MAAISIDKIKKNFGDTPTLDNICLEISNGEFLTRLGPSGCGKSTLPRILAGLEIQDSGSVFIDQHPVDGVRPERRDVAMAFQSEAFSWSRAGARTY